MTIAPTIFTIGHSTHSSAEFIELLRRHGADAVADVRSSPHSRFNPGFNREPLQQCLKAAGVTYAFLGDDLGGRPSDPACYSEGRVQYDRVAATESFKRGVARILHGAQRYRVALLCSEKEPLACHRTLLIAPALVARGIPVVHIHADGGLEPHADAMTRLLADLGLPPRDLYRDEQDVI